MRSLRAAGYLLAFALEAGFGCGGDPPRDPCADAPTFTNDVFPRIIATKCLACHSTELAAEARHGAPAGLDFDTYDLAAPHVEALADAITSGREPPSTEATALGTSKVERDLVELWRRCGFER